MANRRPIAGLPTATAPLLAAAVLALAGCGPDRINFPTPDASDAAPGDAAAGDGAPGDATVTCQAGHIYCAGNVSYYCDPASLRRTGETTCTGATPTCAPGLGCVACDPNAHRCDPMNPDTPQTCTADGMHWTSGARCAADTGQMCVGGACTDPCAEAASRRSYLGCEYWPVTLANGRSNPSKGLGPFSFPFAIIVANPQDRPVTATVEGGVLPMPVTRTIMPGALETIELPWVDELVGATTSMISVGMAYHLRTTAPVTVYQFNPLTFESMGYYSYSNDASLLLPAHALGRRYTAITYSDWSHFGGTLAVVGTGDSETPIQVRVTLRGRITGSESVREANAGDTRTYQLARGDVLQLQGDGSGDLTGSVIDASAPVAVYGGHIEAQVPVGRVAADHLEEQLFPDETWGRQYAVSAFADRPGTPSVVRVVALRDNTRVTFDPPSVHDSAMLGAHETLEFQTPEDVLVTADQPVQVAQYMIGQGYVTMGAGDPAMVLAVPIEQYRTDYTFLVPSTYVRNFVNIVGRAGTTPLLDGMPVSALPRPLGAERSVWSVELMPGTHRVGMRDGMEPYGITVYGVAPYTSYAYPGGLDLRVINPG